MGILPQKKLICNNNKKRTKKFVKKLSKGAFQMKKYMLYYISICRFIYMNCAYNYSKEDSFNAKKDQ